jgi:hypothetical protein
MSDSDSDSETLAGMIQIGRKLPSTEDSIEKGTTCTFGQQGTPVLAEDKGSGTLQEIGLIPTSATQPLAADTSIGPNSGTQPLCADISIDHTSKTPLFDAETIRTPPLDAGTDIDSTRGTPPFQADIGVGQARWAQPLNDSNSDLETLAELAQNQRTLLGLLPRTDLEDSEDSEYDDNSLPDPDFLLSKAEVNSSDSDENLQDMTVVAKRKMPKLLFSPCVWLCICLFSQ